MSIPELLLWLIFAHFIGDWALQSDWMAQNKGKYWFVMLAHCMIWTACICVVLKLTGRFDPCYDLLLLCGLHWIVDEEKCEFATKDNSLGKALYIDQAFHLLQVIVVGIL